MDRQPILILGASARAAAWSAWRTGWLNPVAVDLFGDRDLAGNARVQILPGADYPHGLIATAARLPHGPWLYTGGLENQPNLVDEISRQRPLWGNPGQVLRRVRSPLLVGQTLRQAGLPVPEGRAEPPAADDSRIWLLKPRRGAGGSGIAWWQGQAATRNCYWQEWIEGAPCSALFLADAAGQVVELGVTRQWIGETWLNAQPFQYCGNLGPLSVSAATHQHLEKTGETLVQEFGLRGLFGVDFILQGDVPWPVEVNPRYTAAVEVLERATDFALLSGHGAAFAAKHESYIPLDRPLPRRVVGKAIYFARQDGRFPLLGPWEADLGKTWADQPYPTYADVPAPGTPFQRGQPVLTVFASGRNPEECQQVLRGRIQDLDQRLAE